ncbi:potassium transporter TrkA [Micromonospora sp. DR5-3]|uniref:potassium transporter TrkA n=1 Tax=unclassified Micromonospora TaxID=2617518 RepID=UPI0011D6AB41|nr:MULTISPECIES: potassium transporter TrkA [unclassified Micromonospora]MCW3817396.1 potassium transporter TrkA [Micromonospora sp. DR5-3]TYC19375.1 potassium transporter TrkA [Micromonospora sp. MP36]
MKIERTPLPGIGVRHTFTTAQGRRIGVVEYRGQDRRDVIHDDLDDPDSTCGFRLTRSEAVALAGLLGLLEVVEVAAGGDPCG